MTSTPVTTPAAAPLPPPPPAVDPTIALSNERKAKKKAAQQVTTTAQNTLASPTDPNTASAPLANTITQLSNEEKGQQIYQKIGSALKKQTDTDKDNLEKYEHHAKWAFRAKIGLHLTVPAMLVVGIAVSVATSGVAMVPIALIGLGILALTGYAYVHHASKSDNLQRDNNLGDKLEKAAARKEIYENFAGFAKGDLSPDLSLKWQAKFGQEPTDAEKTEMQKTFKEFLVDYNAEEISNKLTTDPNKFNHEPGNEHNYKQIQALNEAFANYLILTRLEKDQRAITQTVDTHKEFVENYLTSTLDDLRAKRLAHMRIEAEKESSDPPNMTQFPSLEKAVDTYYKDLKTRYADPSKQMDLKNEIKALENDVQLLFTHSQALTQGNWDWKNASLEDRRKIISLIVTSQGKVIEENNKVKKADKDDIDKEIAAFDTILHELEEKVKQGSSEADQKQAELQLFQTEKDAFEKKLEINRQNIKIISNKIKEWEDKKTLFNNENKIDPLEANKKLLHEAQEEKKRIQENLDRLDTNSPSSPFKELKTEIQKKSWLENANKIQPELEKQMRLVDQQILTISANLQELEFTELEDILENIKSLNENLTNLEKEKEDLNSKTTDLIKKTTALEQQITHLTQDLEQDKKNLQNTQQLLAQLKIEGAKIQKNFTQANDNFTITQKWAQIDAQAEENQTAIEASRTKLNAAQKTYQNLSKPYFGDPLTLTTEEKKFRAHYGLPPKENTPEEHTLSIAGQWDAYHKDLKSLYVQKKTLLMLPDGPERDKKLLKNEVEIEKNLALLNDNIALIRAKIDTPDLALSYNHGNQRWLTDAQRKILKDCDQYDIEISRLETSIQKLRAENSSNPSKATANDPIITNNELEIERITRNKLARLQEFNGQFKSPEIT